MFNVLKEEIFEFGGAHEVEGNRTHSLVLFSYKNQHAPLAQDATNSAWVATLKKLVLIHKYELVEVWVS